MLFRILDCCGRAAIDDVVEVEPAGDPLTCVIRAKDEAVRIAGFDPEARCEDCGDMAFHAVSIDD
jgi:hypothetical protein